MNYAVIRIGGKQFMVEKGDTFSVERQNKPLKVETLYYTDGKTILVGTPNVSNVKVKLDIKKNYLDDKVRVARFKSKSRYRKVKGHRQPMSLIEVKDITVESKNAEVKSEKKETSEDSKDKVKKTTVKKSAPKKKTEKKQVKKEEKSK